MSSTLNPVKHQIFTIFVLVTCLIFPALSHAQTTNDQEAQRLKASFQNLLNYQKNVNDALGSIEITYDGELTITRQPTYYTLTFPHIYISNKITNTNKDTPKPPKQTLDLGIITINAMADKKPEYWKIVITLPEKFTLYDAQKTSNDPDLFSVKIGEQRSVALYSEKLGYFTKIDMNLSGLDFLIGGKKTALELEGIQIYTKLEEQQNGKFSGPGHFLLSNLHISPPDQAAEINMEELKLSFYMGDFALSTLSDYKQKILKHAKTLNNLQNIKDKENADNISAQKVFDMITDMYSFDMDSFSFAYSTKNVNIKDTPVIKKGENTTAAKTIHITNSSFGAGVSGLKSDKGTLNIELEYNGFKSTPNDPEASALIPQNLKTKIEAKNVPYKTLGELANNTIRSIIKNPAGAQLTWLALAMRLPAIFSQAETQVVLDGNSINNHIYDISLNGKIATDLSSMAGFVANLKLMFAGLESLLNISQKYSQDKNSVNADKYKKLTDTLKKLKTVGNKNSNSAYSYDIQLNQQGQLTINGQDAKAVFNDNQQEQ